MANSIWTTEQFACPSCGVNYTATREEQREKRTSSYNCSVCDTEVHAWTGYFDFFNWKVIKTTSPVFGRKRQSATPLAAWSPPQES
jgi:DNA-directed RNA polymerase subunit RPC12/RpoP